MFDDDARYRALAARDPRFDGLFFVGVRSTGIFCRSICPARTAGRRQCVFFDHAASASAAGFRPCLRCRPELAPAPPSSSDPAERLVEAIRSGAMTGATTFGALASSHGWSERQARRLVRDATGVTPIQLAQTSRLLLAKQLLTETTLPIIRVASASGYSSLRRFNEAFVASCGVSPSAFRKEEGRGAPGEITLRLDHRPPYDWPAMRGFLDARLIGGVDALEDDSYRRTVRFGERVGTIRIRHVGGRFEIDVDERLLDALQPLVASVRRVLDLDARPDVIDAHLGRSRIFEAQVRRRPGIRVPGTIDPFELVWRAVIGQQVSVKGATTISGRLAARFGEPIETAFGDLTLLSPTADRLARATARSIASIGMPLTRGRTIRDVARRFVDDPNMLADPDLERVRARLLKIGGIGPWTASYVLMRGTSSTDAFPAADLGVRKAMDGLDDASASEVVESWKPWRAYATMRLWNLS